MKSDNDWHFPTSHSCLKLFSMSPFHHLTAASTLPSPRRPKTWQFLQL